MVSIYHLLVLLSLFISTKFIWYDLHYYLLFKPTCSLRMSIHLVPQVRLM
eukprot:UN25043